MRTLIILGSTGSIGVQALEIVDANPGFFQVLAISAAGTNPDQIMTVVRHRLKSQLLSAMLFSMQLLVRLVLHRQFLPLRPEINWL